MHLIALGEQDLGQIRAVLAGDAGNESFFNRNTCFPMVKSAPDVNWHVLPLTHSMSSRPRAKGCEASKDRPDLRAFERIAGNRQDMRILRF